MEDERKTGRALAITIVFGQIWQSHGRTAFSGRPMPARRVSNCTAYATNSPFYYDRPNNELCSAVATPRGRALRQEWDDVAGRRANICSRIPSWTGIGFSRARRCSTSIVILRCGADRLDLTYK